MSSFYVRSKIPTPVLNISNFKDVFKIENGKIKGADKIGHIRSLEFVGLKGTIFEVVKIVFSYSSYEIYKVETKNYPSKGNLFIDNRFVEKVSKEEIGNREIKLSKDEILENLEKAIGEKYCWGGNCYLGIPQILKFYPPLKNISEKLKYKLTLKGIDCSGLLFEATSKDGGHLPMVPRNVSWMIDKSFGEVVKIEENSEVKDIVTKLKPLDLILFKGHVIIVVEKGYVIESRGDDKRIKEEIDGVIKTKIEERLKELLRTKRIKNNCGLKKEEFVIKRWH
jgi:cell wall-associated NlpC family hydrolase